MVVLQTVPLYGSRLTLPPRKGGGRVAAPRATTNGPTGRLARGEKSPGRKTGATRAASQQPENLGGHLTHCMRGTLAPGPLLGESRFQAPPTFAQSSAGWHPVRRLCCRVRRLCRLSQKCAFEWPNAKLELPRDPCLLAAPDGRLAPVGIAACGCRT